MEGECQSADAVKSPVRTWLTRWPELIVGWSLVALLAGAALRFGWPVVVGSGAGERLLRVASVLLWLGLPSVLYAVVVLPVLFIEYARDHRVAGCLGCFGLAVLCYVGPLECDSLMRNSARVPPCLINLYIIGTALRTYAGDHGGVLPDSLGDLPEDVVDERILTCPAARERGVPDWRNSYEYVGAGLRLADIKRPGDVPLVFDSANRHANGRNVGFADGTRSWMKEGDFRQTLFGAIDAGAYAPETVARLRKAEPWLETEQGPGGAGRE